MTIVVWPWRKHDGCSLLQKVYIRQSPMELELVELDQLVATRMGRSKGEERIGCGGSHRDGVSVIC
jgi:hypothetical protein